MRVNWIGLTVALVLLPAAAFARDRAPKEITAEFIAEATAAAAKYDVKILRDTWGVPHIFGTTNEDTAFGLAFAHSEDDYLTIEETMLAARGVSAAVLGTDAAPVDFMVHLLGVWDTVEEKYESDLEPETRAICEAYAEGLNYYIALNPDEARLPEVYPVTGKDVVAGFVFKGPFFYGLDRAVQELFGSERRREVSEKQAALEGLDLLAAAEGMRSFLTDGMPTGSNTFSVGPERSTDGSTFLAVNSHQPWTGPVAWYEAHLKSEEGWDAVGGIFPGAPVVLHGHNRHLGWAHTVNSPDLIDIYVLEMNPDNPDQYKFDGEWRDLEKGEATLKVKINPDSPMTMNIKREILSSVHGPVMRQDHGVYAIRYAGAGDIRQVEQWFKMDMATNFDEFMDAMKMRAIPSLNVGYADKDGNIMYLYNALMPKRAEGYDWEQYLPGDTSDTLWTEYLPFDALPIVTNPPSGFVQNCNASPFQATDGAGNPDPADFSETLGIETHMTNRSLRALETLGQDDSISWSEFFEYKYDMAYSTESFMGKSLVALENLPPQDDPLVQEALALLEDWDLSTRPDSNAAALAVMTVRPLYSTRGDVPDADKLLESLTSAATLLKEEHGRIDVPWNEVNRLKRGDADLGMGGGPDILHAVYGQLNEETAQYEGSGGDSYILMVRWDKDGELHSESIHQFGSATLDESSPHYADQAVLFAQRQMKPVWLDEDEIRANLKAEYRPGEAW